METQVTAFELQVIKNIIKSEFQTEVGEGIIDSAIWSWSATNEDKHLAGALGSLVKKGYCFDESYSKKEKVCGLTKLGYELACCLSLIETPEEQEEVTIQERIYAMRTALSAQFLEKIKELGLHIAENAMVVIHETQVEIGIRKDEYNFEFASEFPIYSIRDDYFEGKTKNKMNICSSGAFDPSNLASFWRTVHAGEVLKNWDAVCEIVNQFCGLFSDFLENMRAIQEEVEKKYDGEIIFRDSPIPSNHLYAIRGVLCDFYQSQQYVFVYVKP